VLRCAAGVIDDRSGTEKVPNHSDHPGVETKVLKMKKMISTLAAALFAVSIGSTQPGCVASRDLRPSVIDIVSQMESHTTQDLENIVRSVRCLRSKALYLLDIESASPAPPTKSRTGHGTAFAYMHKGGYTYLITNTHVVQDPEELVEITLSPGPEPGTAGISVSRYLKIAQVNQLVDDASDDDDSDDIDLEVVATNEELDIAVVKTRSFIPNFGAYLVDTGIEPEVGEEVYVVGYPRGRYSAVTRGIIAHPDHIDDDDGEHLDILDVNSTFGNSGSPYFVRRGGALYWAGIMGKISTYPESRSTMFTLGTPISTFADMLDDPEGYAADHAADHTTDHAADHVTEHGSDSHDATAEEEGVE